MLLGGFQPHAMLAGTAVLDPPLLRHGTELGRGMRTNLPVVELPVDVDLPLGDEARQIGDGVGDIWGKAGWCEPRK